MNFVALNTSIVVLAQAHNPTILHPSFLSSEGIVPPDWKPSEPPICTPAISLVKYENGIVFTAEMNKLMILDNAGQSKSDLPELSLKYIEKLPHVHYSAVGVNITGYCECANAEEWIMQRFLKPGPGTEAPLKPNAVGLKFVYSIAGAVFNLTCDAADIQLDGARKIHGLMINGNYHIAVEQENWLKNTKIAIQSFQERLAHFSETTDIIFGDKC